MSEKRVVVIGAGLGGLSAAAHLARKGFSVDLFERHHMPGGYANSFVRNGFEFEASLHALSGIGPEGHRGPCYRLLEACDVARRVEFIPIREFYASRFPDFTAVIPLGWEAAEEAYGERFPRERNGLRRLMRFMRDMMNEMEAFTAKSGLLHLLSFPMRGGHLIRSTGLTLAQAMGREISDPALKALFCNVWGYYGLPPSRLAFTLFGMGNASYLEYGPYHVKGTSQALSNAFVASIEDHGGRVHLRNGIRKVEVSRGRVTGVVTERGDDVPADYIVSNANPIHCCHDLIGPDKVPAAYLKSLGEGRIAVSTFNVYMGLDCPADQLGLKHHEFFVNESYDMEDHYQGMFRIGRQKYYVITTYNASDPQFSRPGTSVVVLTALHDYEAWSRVPPDRYAETRSRMADEMIRAADEVFPGLRDHIAVLETATPITNMRYSGNPGGSILGFDYNLTGSPMFRLSNRGPLEGLFFANAWVRLGGGYEPCITSGYLAYGEIMKDEKGLSRAGKMLPRFDF
jgi:phytoene dehydrogenase-like protein